MTISKYSSEKENYQISSGNQYIKAVAQMILGTISFIAIKRVTFYEQFKNTKKKDLSWQFKPKIWNNLAVYINHRKVSTFSRSILVSSVGG